MARKERGAGQGHKSREGMPAAEKKREARAHAAKTAALTLAAFAAVSAAILLLRAFAFPPRGDGPSPASPPAAAARAGQASEADGEESSHIMEESLQAEDAAASADGSAPAPPSSGIEVPEGDGALCFVFDDAGHNLFHLEPFLNLPFPCTIAVLPSLAHSAEAAEQIRGAGKELILHQPMQAINLDVDPGPGAVLPGMTAEEIRDVVNANLDEIWPVAGLNNHEGSLITGDAGSMEAVLDVAEARSIFFLDSKTTAGTASRGIADERGMRILERAVFLDNSPDEDAILAEVLRGARIAARSGFAIMIGHVWSPHLAQMLAELYPALAEAGYRIEDLSALLAELEERDARLGGAESPAEKDGERG